MRLQIHRHRYILLSLLLVAITLLIDEAIFSDEKQRVSPRAKITENLEVALDELDEHLQSISSKAVLDLNRLFSRFESDDQLPYFLYENGEVIYWSTNRFVPKYGTLEGPYVYRFLALESGQYIVKRKVINSAGNRVAEIFTLLPLSSKFPISSEFERTGLNAKIFGRTSFDLFANQSESENNIYSKEGLFLFSFDGSNKMKVVYPVYATFILLLYLLAIICFVKGVWGYIKVVERKNNPALAIFLLIAGLIVVRFFMVKFEFPRSLVEWEVFDPKVYADGLIQPSLGDLLINVICLLAIVSYVYLTFSSSRQTKQRILTESIGGAIAVIGLIAIFSYVLHSVMANAQWSFDIAREIGFTFEKITALVSIFLTAVSAFLVTQWLLKRLHEFERSKWINLILVLSIVGFAALSWLLWDVYLFSVALIVLFIFVAFQAKMALQLGALNYNTFLYFFLAAFFWSTISAVHLSQHIREEALQDKQSLAIELQSTNDLTAEYLLSEAKSKIESDVLIQTNISNPFSSKDLIQQKIRRVFLGDYFDKYDIDILLFNGRGNPINAGATLDFDVLKEVYAKDVYATDFEGLFFLHAVGETDLKQYYLFCDIKRYNTAIGQVLVKLDRKEQLNNSILPQLILDQSENIKNLSDYSYATYRAGRLINSSGDFNYERDFNSNLLSDERLTEDGLVLENYLHVSFTNSAEEEKIVISSPTYPFRYQFTNFSVFFLSMVAMIILIFGASALLANARKKGTTISAKVQILLNFAFFLPLVMVSIVVLSLVNETVERNLEQQYLETTASAGQNIATQLDQFLSAQNENIEGLESTIAQISEYARADINLFNASGRLLATNQRLIFDNNLLAPYADPTAMLEIVEAGNTQKLGLESVGDLNYKSTYFGVRDSESDKLLGVLSMPFFDSQEQLVKEQREILSNILNSFTFIFLIFIILSFLAARVITYPFTYLTNKIKATTLTQTNKPLAWPTDDEIGLMVKEYNNMLDNLEKSKKELALREKESAWREMAQQVAHEIKNPLTPMKLKLQHLKRVLNEAPDLGNEFNRPIDNLLAQVETLSDIATSFSSFAKMPVPQSARMNLTDVLKKSINLFNEDRVEINSNIPKRAIWVMADEKLLGRIFNNLILNAAQAAEEGLTTNLEIELVETHNKARVIFTDDGVGIPDAARDKIFIPKFSTKSEGSGIGLAIAKRGVEHAGGSIWFESEEGKGTTFYLEFPLID